MAARGLVIRKPYVDWILDGLKTWEIRSRRSKIRGPIALIESGSGKVVGTCELVDCVGPLTQEQYIANAKKMNRTRAEAREQWSAIDPIYAWVFADAQRLPKPIAYDHPQGAVTWVRLTDGVRKRVKL
jgi:hypothetical protein